MSQWVKAIRIRLIQAHRLSPGFGSDLWLFAASHSLSLSPFYLFDIMFGEREDTTAEREKERERGKLYMVSPPCRVVKRIEGWLDCTGQLLWCKDVPPCQTHRCRVMSQCELEFCQNPASLFCSLVLCLPPSHLLPSSSISVLLFNLCAVSCSVFILKVDLSLTLMSVLHAQAPFYFKNDTNTVFRWGLDSLLWPHGIK